MTFGRGAGAVEGGQQEAAVGVIGMSGHAGDVFLIDMRVLHTPSINSTKNMRMMAASRCFLNA